jgi:hypothetical protein
MAVSILRRKWFKGLITSAHISLDMLDRCIDDMSMRQLAKIKVENVLEILLWPTVNDQYVRAAALSLSFRLASCGLVERRLLSKYGRRKIGGAGLSCLMALDKLSGRVRYRNN